MATLRKYPPTPRLQHSLTLYTGFNSLNWELYPGVHYAILYLANLLREPKLEQSSSRLPAPSRP